MKDLNQATKLTIPDTISEVQTTCNGCGEEIKVRKMPIIGGPNKGKIVSIPFGCKCEEKRLAKETIELKEKAIIKKHLADFEEMSLINPDLKDVTFQDYKPKNESQAAAAKESSQYVREFDLKQAKNLLFYGSFGVGKSHLAVAIQKALMKRDHSCIFISIPKLLTMFRDTYNKASEKTEKDLIRALELVDCLVLDDLGAESPTKWAMDKLFEVVDSRQGRHTIYTSNYKPEDLMKRLGERNFSRVLNLHTKPIEVVGDNHRLGNFLN
jgi:DNA replication protein DnaC